ncbi:tubby C-terminal-like domain-containing protein [Aspergillus pseudonomiae]|uniref:Tubby C-terminal-like domain-containing protein n=1 Tax=Aspergillus pseudonomiae TaxID=1506151 RepID=A0A5N7DDG2_9EURO|nr:tubby C-terminal-like domain-containing protein [Aspergillus pseudonomiae]KAE8404407.1 tubby C-terminal-like domain-containing protein [Aspergillus pseudonomiae]
MASQQLPPVPAPVAIMDQFIAPQTETLVLKEKVLSLSGDSFDVKLASGQPIFQIKAKHMSVSGRKSVFDMAGNHLFDLVKEHLHIHSTFAAQAPDGRKLLEVKSSLSLIGSKATATFTSPRTGSTVSLKMKGNWRDSKADIVDEATGAVVAQIDRKLLRARQMFFDQQTYAVIVAPGVDLALIAALCVCFDEKNNEQ